MQIALLGYGKMGKVIEELATAKGHHIALTIDNEQEWEEKKSRFANVDVAIDFSTPETVIDNINRCFELKIPIVIGTTGWYKQIEELKYRCEKDNHTLLWASNFSIGVNIFFKINESLAQLMNHYDDYQVNLEEIHHTGKLDAPSGTAISLANDIIAKLDRKKNWQLGQTDDVHSLSVIAKRIDPVPGTHTIKYESDIDSIEIIHTAKSRKGFAIGALTAAEWILEKKGFYEFKEVFF